MAATIKTVFCYSHTDEALAERLRIQLKSLQRAGYIDIWYDRDIPAGKEWQREIDKELGKAQLILLLVSPDFIASDYCYRVEMKHALERHEQGKARVIPIILRPIRFEDAPFSKLQALPKDAIPITRWSDIDEAFQSIEYGIREAVSELQIEVTARRNPYCILVVDDDPSIQRALRSALRTGGYEVLIADHGSQAVEMVHTKQPDLILLDLGLPGDIDGIEVCKLVRQWSQVPIIIVSARMEESLKVLALDLGADDYLTKPFSSNELLARVRASLRRATNIENTQPTKILTSEDGYLSLDSVLRQV
ncbi:MAG TPA: response regulator, partial [Methylomirabilota bacterium]|nr:response regulator [Methylomirabilota bacterium]